MIKKPISEGRNRPTSTVPKLKSHKMYKYTPDSDWVKAVLHSRAGKVGGKFDACFNVFNKKGEMSWLDFNRCVSDWQPITLNEPTEIVLFMNDEMSETEKDTINNAKVKELANWKNNQVYTEVEDKNQKKLMDNYNKSYWRKQN